jgi:phage gpG-like protein
MGINKFKTDGLFKRWNRVKNDVPVIVARTAENHFKQSFQLQKFNDDGADPWKKRKSRSAKNEGRAILVQSGRLMRSIRASKISWNRIDLGSPVKYGKYHNDGIYPQPPRKFMGESKSLNRKLKQIVKDEIINTFK